jgi:hypothetical protein
VLERIVLLYARMSLALQMDKLGDARALASQIDITARSVGRKLDVGVRDVQLLLAEKKAAEVLSRLAKIDDEQEPVARRISHDLARAAAKLQLRDKDGASQDLRIAEQWMNESGWWRHRDWFEDLSRQLRSSSRCQRFLSALRNRRA